MRDRPRLLLKGLQYTIALGALAYVLLQVEWQSTLPMLADLELTFVVGIFLVTVFEFVSRFSMWYVLLNQVRDVSFTTSGRIDLVIKFINHVIPSKASGHSIAPLVLRHYAGVDWTTAVTVAGVNTGLYAFLYGCTAFVGVALFAPRLTTGLLLVLVGSAGLYLFVGCLILLAGRRLDAIDGPIDWLQRSLSNLPLLGERLAALVGKFPSFDDGSAAQFRELSTSLRSSIPYALGWAGTLMIAPGVRAWILLVAFGSGFSPGYLLPIILVLAYSVTILPITPGGVGVAEASATLVFVSVGIPESIAVTVVILDRTLGVYLPALLGWIPVAKLDVPGLISDNR